MAKENKKDKSINFEVYMDYVNIFQAIAELQRIEKEYSDYDLTVYLDTVCPTPYYGQEDSSAKMYVQGTLKQDLKS